MAVTMSSSCTSFWNFRSTKLRPASMSSSRHGGYRGCKGLDGAAMWLINGVTTAFFASLERCSCIRVNTVEDADDINEVPLMYDDGNTRYDHDGGSSSSSVSRRRYSRGSKDRAYADYDE